MDKLAKIEDIVEIEDYSVYIALFSFISILIIIALIYRFYKKKRAKKPTKEELALKAYKKIEFSNPKKAAYQITKYGYILAKNEKSKDIFKELLSDISRYKYKKKVEPFDEKSIGLYNLFLEVVTNE